MNDEPNHEASRDTSTPEIREALQRRADRAGLVPSSLGEVQRRARGIRRRRTGWTVGAAAAAIVVVAGLGVALGPRLDDRGAPAPATTGPTPSAPGSASPSPTAPTSPSPPPPSTAIDPSASATGPTLETFTVDLNDVREGTGPSLRIPNWYRGTLTDAHGQHAVPVTDRPEWPVLDQRTGAWHAMVTEPATGEIRWNAYRSNGTVAGDEQAVSPSVAVTPDGSTYAVLLKDGGLGTRLVVAGAQQWHTAIGGGQSGYEVAGILPDGNVVIGDSESRTTVVHPDGTQDHLPGTTPAAVNPVTGDIAVRTKQGDALDSCWGLESETGKAGAETCDYVPVGFNASGTLLFAYDTGLDNVPDGTFRIHLLDARTLRPVASFTTAKGQSMDVLDAAWMGDSLVVPVRGKVGGAESWEIGLLSRNGVTLIPTTRAPARGDQPPPYSFGAGPLTVE